MVQTVRHVLAKQLVREAVRQGVPFLLAWLATRRAARAAATAPPGSWYNSGPPPASQNPPESSFYYVAILAAIALAIIQIGGL
jgi:hypothetical protein